MGFRRWRSGLKNLFLGPEILDSGEKHLRITRELLQHPQMIGQRQHSHRTARLPLLQHILQHLRTCIGLILNGEFVASRSNTVGMPAGVKFSGWLEKTPAGAGVAAAVRLLMPGGTKMETFCFLPFSSSVKSSGFKPVTGWPFLWVTTTSTTTSREFARMVMVGTSAGAGACWALKIAPVPTSNTRPEPATP